MTSNLGTTQEQFQDMVEMRAAVMRAIRQAFKPEFLNRIDDVIVFQPLGDTEMRAITRIQLDDLAARLRDRGIGLEVAEPAVLELARRGYDPVYGARPLKRLIQQAIEGAIARAILGDEARDGDTVSVGFDSGEFKTSVLRSREAAEIQG
jgi:ATP-dependent Clp protease ATP-binding subunit ClpB